ncbi:anti-sigma-F factor Fin family protein [Caldibacillus lycopersici]|uniref:Anti-sigma-F factor Fin family protein n=1 Tax=Perspicuibacillus lycopersici TaxID=1325689 RepID=A0AAE3J093_9BACI|nr:anti-sigma-F factor Fin family protein [Perspicuibacillus lycopersici]MCU9615285.1 anti-sigma-F factor Fin family protein [Perspicuibacillus lycopersici]
MAVHYHCRHCGTTVGSLDNNNLYSEQLGFHKLSEDERQDMISYDSSGDIHVKCICEDCHESFAKNPLNYENDYIIH